VQINETVVQAEVDDEVLLLDVENGTYFGLDGVGNRIWQLLSDGATTEAMVETLEDEYEVDRAQLRTDIATFLHALQQRGLIHEATE
jgi:hypothetical protein